MASAIGLNRGLTRRRVVKGGMALAASVALGSRRRALANHAQPVDGVVIAEGVSEIPSDPFAWRLIRDTARQEGEAELLERALGFVYAPDGIEIVSADAGSQLVDPGEGGFIAEGVVQRHQSLATTPHDYLRIGIVPPEDADYTAGGELLFGSEAFSAPSGKRVLRLYRIDVGPGELFTFPPSAVPILVHVLSGGTSIGKLIGSVGPTPAPTTGEPHPAVAGDTLLVEAAPGEKWGLGGAGATTAIAAVIGEPSSASADGPGEIFIQVFACPDGTVLSPDNVADCALDEAMASLSFAKLEGNGLELTLDDMTSREGDRGWQGLPLGDYTLSIENNYWVAAAPGDEAALGEPTGNTALAWPVSLTAENPRVSVRILGAAA